jgi:hypothetical protein
MDEKLVALLQKSRIFSPGGINPYEIMFIIEGMRDFEFFLPNCFDYFNEKTPKYLKQNLKIFLRRYLDAWVEIVRKDPSADFSWEEHSKKVFNFFGNFSWDEIYEKVESGKEAVNLKIEANGSLMRIKRFGDILAFNILNLHNTQKEHVRGLKAVRALCRINDPNNNHGVYEIIHKVKIQLKIKTERVGNTKEIIDFDSFFGLLKKELPWVEWNLNVVDLIDDYTQKTFKGLVVGCYHGFDIRARLIHLKMIDDDSSRYSDTIWRKGNVVLDRESRFVFLDCFDLFFELSIESSFPSWAGDNDVKTRYLDEQFKLAEVSALLISQLSAMQLEQYRTIRDSMKD